MSADLAALETRIGHEFRNRELLYRALTHRSRSYEQNAAEPASDNEQMEFLGDAILGFLVSEFLCENFRGYSEGQLSVQKARLVSAVHLHTVAESIGLGSYLLLGKGEELSGGRLKRALLSDAIEALIAALYLDGGIDAVRGFIVRHVLSGVLDAVDTDPSPDNFKGQLVELAHALKLPQPRYTTVDQLGPEHAKVFVVEVSVGENWAERAEGSSKKIAGQRAAQQVLAKLHAARANF